MELKDIITMTLSVLAIAITAGIAIRQHNFHIGMQSADVRLRARFEDGQNGELTISNHGPGVAVAVDIVCMAAGKTIGVSSSRRIEPGEEVRVPIEADSAFTAYLQWVHRNGTECNHSFHIDPGSERLQGNGWPAWLREIRPGRYNAEIQRSIEALRPWQHHPASEWEPKPRRGVL